MKANEAPDFPEKVYIPRDPEYPQFPDIWWERESDGSNIEYVRKDAFIEEAKNWLYLQLNEINMEGEDMENFLEDFKNYMKGE